MKRKLIASAILAICASFVMANLAFSSDCSNAMVSAMQEEGLTREQINRICLRAAMKQEGLSNEQIDRIISKTESMPAVTPQAAPMTAPAPVTTHKSPVAPAATPAAAAPAKVLDPAFTPEKIESDIIGKCVGGIMTGWCFGKGEYRKIEVLETDVDRNMAKIVFYIETIKDHSGKMIADYRIKKGEWELDDLDPLTFK